MTEPERTGRGEPEIVILPDPDRVSGVAAERIAALLAQAAETHGRVDFATTGGSAPVGIYQRLAVAPLREAVPWQSVQVWWGDDRFVPRDHPLSNVLPFDTVLLNTSSFGGESGEGGTGIDVMRGIVSGVYLPPENIHPFPCPDAIAHGLGIDWCAAAYATELLDSPIRRAGAWPVFDLVLLGLGPDGHLLSVFPNSPALDSEQLALGIPAPTQVEPHVPRVTLNPRVVDVADHVILVSTGAAKAGIVGRIFGPNRDERMLPAQRTRRTGVTWILDAAASSDLPDGLNVTRLV
ncbi:MAG TPA: 6-phosphogluconolactonase [Candidatus Saccharimonadales bacterium]|nr:6-phosphogluconolactonase [Candidatus Saccharimonadales bacterium]